MDIKVHKNFLKKKEFKHLEDSMFKFGNTFPWYLYPITSPQDKFLQLTHIYHDGDKFTSAHSRVLLPVLELLKPKKLLRIKANLVMKDSSIKEHGYHVDFLIPGAKTAILYINSNNGYTRFKEGRKILSERNKIIKFIFRKLINLKFKLIELIYLELDLRLFFIIKFEILNN